ncbi:oxidoreductase [Alphaproteobacteria bacterium]|nr:oxidoreductase [Alphaproteobacteria bacterium]
MILGDFKFSIRTAANQGFKRSTDYNNAKIDRIGELPYFQRLGISGDKIDIDGVFYPDFTGNYKTIDNLRTSALANHPHTLITDAGDVLGTFVITNISETQSHFKPDGTPRKIEFSLSLERTSEESTETLSGFLSVASNLLERLIKW